MQAWIERGSGDRMKPTPVSPAQAKEMLDRGDGIVFVDARNPVAWGSSTVKLPGAIRIPVDEVEEHLSELPRDRTAITYCT
jgi:rhodanese-related sulfurtransferase